MAKSGARGRVSLPAKHDVLGNPTGRNETGPPDGTTSFRQTPPSTSTTDFTSQTPDNSSNGNQRMA